MKPAGFEDERQDRVQFKDKNNTTLFVFKGNSPWLCSAWAPQFQSGGNWSLELPMANLTAAPGLGFLSLLIGNPHFSFWPSIFKPRANFQAPKGESFELFDIFDVKV